MGSDTQAPGASMGSDAQAPGASMGSIAQAPGASMGSHAQAGALTLLLLLLEVERSRCMAGLVRQARLEMRASSTRTVEADAQRDGAQSSCLL
eukprot:gene6707-8028_t